MKKYHISDILSVTTEMLVSTRRMAGVQDILDYMTDLSLYTHQIPDAMKVCKIYLLEQFPQLKDVTVGDITDINHKKWVNEKIKEFGEYLEVEKLEKEQCSSIH